MFQMSNKYSIYIKLYIYLSIIFGKLHIYNQNRNIKRITQLHYIQIGWNFNLRLHRLYISLDLIMKGK